MLKKVSHPTHYTMQAPELRQLWGKGVYTAMSDLYTILLKIPL